MYLISILEFSIILKNVNKPLKKRNTFALSFFRALIFVKG